MKRTITALCLSAVCSSALPAESAIVNTPGDGFLALRSAPSTSSGARLAKIPHGTRVLLGECVSTPTTDRWCSTSFEGQRGWVLDRFLGKQTGRPNKAIAGGTQSPGKGDRLRIAILDAIRAEYSKPVTLQVHHLKVRDDWAWACVAPPNYEGSCYLVRKERGEWQVLGEVQGGQDEDLYHLQYRDLRSKFPEAPRQIFD